MSMPGTTINEYVERTFGRFFADRGPEDPPPSPWMPMPAPGLERLQAHLSDHYGVEVRSLTPMDCGVVRVDRSDKSRWVARVFPPARSLGSTEDDVAVLRWLAAHDVPAERLAHDEALTSIDEHAVVVTDFAPGKPISSFGNLTDG